MISIANHTCRRILPWMFFLALWSCQSPPPASVANGYERLVTEGATGTLFIIGGGSRPLSLMEGVVRRLPSPDALVLVMPMASSQPDTSLLYGMRPLKALGCTNVHPMHVESSVFIARPLQYRGGLMQGLWKKKGSRSLIKNFRDVTLCDGKVYGSHNRSAILDVVNAVVNATAMGSG